MWHGLGAPRHRPAWPVILGVPAIQRGPVAMASRLPSPAPIQRTPQSGEVHVVLKLVGSSISRWLGR
jgi:hypothetical protein